MDKKRIIFIINPISGTGSKAKIPPLIEATLDRQRFDYELRYTEHAGHAAEIAREEAERGTDVVVAVGGDGTVNEVARSLTHTHTALAIIPCGSGNGLARHLCLPMDCKRAIEVINACHIEPMDYGVINDRPFFCTCGMGFDAEISLRFAEAGKRGLATYVKEVLKLGLAYKGATYELTDAEERRQTVKAYLIACANASQYGNNAYIAPGATMRDGEMNVVLMEPFSLLSAPRLGAALFLKTLTRHHKVRTLKASRIHIHREQAGAIHFDGDPVRTGQDIDIRIEPKGIFILTNPQSPEDQTEPSPAMSKLSDALNRLHKLPFL